MSRTIGIITPADFPTVEHDQLASRAPEIPGVEWSSVGPSLTATAWRFLAAAEADDRLRSSLTAYGDSPPFGERASQEIAMFTLLSAATSSVECLVYGIFAMGAALDPQRFPITTERQRRNVSPGSAAQALLTAFPTDPLGPALDGLVSDPAWADLRDWRDVAVHRAALPRLHKRSLGPRLVEPAEWQRRHHRGSDVEVSGVATATMRTWLGGTLRTLIVEADSWLARQGVNPP